jgi:hypothetical protein
MLSYLLPTFHLSFTFAALSSFKHTFPIALFSPFKASAYAKTHHFTIYTVFGSNSKSVTQSVTGNMADCDAW